MDTRRSRTAGNPAQDPRLPTPTILTVDDEQVNRTLLHDMLEPVGYRPLGAANGAEALQQVEQCQPDLVLLDAMMPPPDGFEVCRRIKSNPTWRRIPVVMVTALHERADRIRAIEAGADDFVSKPFDRQELLARVRSLLRLKQFTDELEHAEGVLFALARSVEARDPYTEGHCERLSAYSVALGRELGLPEADLEALHRGGILHDLGKVAVSDAILLKPGPLTPEERRIMEEHPVQGYEICRPLRSFRDVLPIIRHHHEKFDGSGYPDRLKGQQIPLTARVLQIVDVYDALTTDRPYRRGLSAAEALEVMEHEVQKGWWDPDLYAVFRQMVESGRQQTLEVKLQSISGTSG